MMHSKNLTTAIAGAVLLVSLSACGKTGLSSGEKASAGCEKPLISSNAKGSEKVKGIAGMDSECEQVSYVIGMDIAKSLEEIKADVDPALLSEGIIDQLAGKAKLNEQQHKEIREAFGVKLQAYAEKMAAELPAKNLAEGKAFLEKNKGAAGVVTTASGLQYKVLRAGSGAKPSADSIVKVNYKGSLLDGKVFDSSYDRNEPVEFPLNQVVPGWSEGVGLMNVGSKYQFWIPSDLAYGEAGSPPVIGPNATLVFEVELLEIKAAQ